MTTNWFLRVTYAACLLLSVAVPSLAADPVLQQLVPQGAQRGTEVEVLISGARFQDGPYQVLLYETGIEVGNVESVEGKQVKCVFRLAADCRLGRHALRLRTASGLSNLVTFHVSNLKEIKEAEPNNTSEQPQEIATDVVVNGLVTGGDTDVYAVTVAAGERLSVEIEGLRLGRTLFDPMIELYDEAGSLLASNDDQPAANQDAFVSIRAKKAGRVFVHVRESAYRGSGAATYRLHVGRFPRPVAVFPPAAVPGKPAELRWIGETFDEKSVTVEVPPIENTRVEGNIYEAHAVDEQGVSPSGLSLFLYPSPPALEIEPNNSRETATEMTAPGIACGVISEPSDKDFFRFTMKKGEQWDFRVRARELRSPLDTVIHLYGPDGKYLKGNDDDSGQPDSYLRFKAPVDGEYTLDVEDRLLRGRREMVYVLDISKPSAIAELQFDERKRYQAQVINIPQGGRIAAMMTVKRKDFGGPLQVEFSELPAGSEVEAVPLAGNYNRLPVLFSAKPQAELGAALVTVTATLTENPQPMASRFRQQTWLVKGRNNVKVWSHYADRAAVAVTSALPYSISVVEPKAPLVRGGAMELKVVVQRKEGFEKAIAVRTIYNPPGVSTNQSRSIPAKGNEVLIPITANGSARLGDWKIVFLGKTSINGAVEASTQLATLRISEPFFDVKIPTITVLQGDTAELVVALEHRHPFEGEAEIELLRLPQGVSAEKVKIKADGKSAVFQLKIAKEARVGRHRGVGCQIRLTVDGDPVRYSQGYVDLSVDPAIETKNETAADSQTAKDQAS
ncbi:MAG: hypothetical protein GXP24_09365 [Planctomycetes bacterium]|nr:hypothetical protein [Planctomycetota bacterium]